MFVKTLRYTVFQGISHPLVPEGGPWDPTIRKPFSQRNSVMNAILHIYTLKKNHIQAKKKKSKK